MAQKFEWTKQRETAARLVADDKLTDDAITEQVGISNRQLDRWKNEPEFKARVAELVGAWKERVRQKFLAIKERRVETLCDDYRATDVILEERGRQLADSVDVDANPYAGGARTGFIARDYKGKDADVPVYAFDAALMRERRELRKQIAQELGEWSEKHEHTGKDGGPLTVAFFDDLVRKADAAAGSSSASEPA